VVSALGALGALGLAAAAPEAQAYVSRDGSLEIHGFMENVTYARRNIGLSKFRNTMQIEVDNNFGEKGPFSSLSFHTILRGTYDGVYDLNKSDYGKNAGGPILLESTGQNTFVPHGGGIPLPSPVGFNIANNPNDGLEVLGSRFHPAGGGVTFGVPVRPCDVDPRGCIAGYMDATRADLRFPEFNSRADFIREAYFDLVVPLDNGHELNFRVGKQQVVWGRTDLFRVLDVINPVDFSRNNIYDELEDIRIPMWILTAEYRLGGTGVFDDLNFQLVWNWDKFRPDNLGQGGTPNAILDAGSFFRGMKNCWDNGCTVSNFANGTIATNFPAGVLGIRQAQMRSWSLKNTQIGGRIEGVFKSVGFSLNYMNYISQLPSLHGGSAGPAAINPFALLTGPDCITAPDCPFPADFGAAPRPYLIAFDITFPRINLFGGSMDFYVDPIKTVFRLEAAYTTGEEFANSLRPELFSKSDVIRYVIGIDRNTFIPFLNRRRAFLLSAQLFGQHILQHERAPSAGSALGIPGFTELGIPDFKANWIATFLIKGWWLSDRLSPQLLYARDFRARANVISPSVDWLISDSWRLVVAGIMKWGRGANQKWDDCRSCNPFPPFTATPLHGNPMQPGSVGLAGFEPLGRFRAGPIGMADKQDEIQVTIRYRF